MAAVRAVRAVVGRATCSLRRLHVRGNHSGAKPAARAAGHASGPPLPRPPRPPSAPDASEDAAAAVAMEPERAGAMLRALVAGVTERAAETERPRAQAAAEFVQEQLPALVDAAATFRARDEDSCVYGAAMAAAAAARRHDVVAALFADMHRQGRVPADVFWLNRMVRAALMGLPPGGGYTPDQFAFARTALQSVRALELRPLESTTKLLLRTAQLSREVAAEGDVVESLAAARGPDKERSEQALLALLTAEVVRRPIDVPRVLTLFRSYCKQRRRRRGGVPVLVHTRVLEALGRAGEIDALLAVFDAMRESDPSALCGATLRPVLQALSQHGDVERIMAVVRHAEAAAVASSEYVWLVLGALGRADRPEQVQRFFATLRARNYEPNFRDFDALLSGLLRGAAGAVASEARRGFLLAAVDAYHDMRRANVVPSARQLNKALSAARSLEAWSVVLELVAAAPLEARDAEAVCSAANAALRLGRVPEAVQLLSDYAGVLAVLQAPAPDGRAPAAADSRSAAARAPSADARAARVHGAPDRVFTSTFAALEQAADTAGAAGRKQNDTERRRTERVAALCAQLGRAVQRAAVPVDVPLYRAWLRAVRCTQGAAGPGVARAQLEDLSTRLVALVQQTAAGSEPSAPAAAAALPPLAASLLRGLARAGAAECALPALHALMQAGLRPDGALLGVAMEVAAQVGGRDALAALELAAEPAAAAAAAGAAAADPAPPSATALAGCLARVAAEAHTDGAAQLCRALEVVEQARWPLPAEPAALNGAVAALVQAGRSEESFSLLQRADEAGVELDEAVLAALERTLTAQGE